MMTSSILNKFHILFLLLTFNIYLFAELDEYNKA